MSDLPPPTFGPPSGGTPPFTPGPPPGFGTPPPPPPPVDFRPVGAPEPWSTPPDTPREAKKSNTGKIVAVIVVVLALAAGGVFVLTRGDDKNDASSTTVTDATASDDTDDVTDLTLEPGSTVTTSPATTTSVEAETTTSLAPTTTAEASTTTTPTSVFTVPDGAIDLGHQVYLPIPAGWAQTNDPGDVVVISDGAGSSASFQALARDAGEDITQLTQEYTDTFDADFGAVGFGPMRFVTQIDGPHPIDEYSLFYTTYDPGDARGIDGTITIFVRDDGLSLIYDSYTTVGLIPLPDEAYKGLLDGMLAAAPLGVSVPLVTHDPFRVKSLAPFLEVLGVVGFTTTPGFETVAAGSGHGQVSNGVETVEVITTNPLPDSASVVVNAQGYLGATYTGTSFGPPTEDAADVYGVIHGTLTWTGSAADGTAAAGTIDYYYDPASQIAYIMFRNWTSTPGSGEPFAAESAFMRRTFYNSLTTIP
jgi:hypothetical protein